jgi:hypothetical protein
MPESTFSHGISIISQPLQGADFPTIVRSCGMDQMVLFSKFMGVDLELIDFRREATRLDWDCVMSGTRTLSGDPRGNTAVDRGQDSWLHPLSPGYERYRVTCYDPGEMKRHHNETVNEYLVSNNILQADIVIDIP